jgi:hypothetical protein
VLVRRHHSPPTPRQSPHQCGTVGTPHTPSLTQAQISRSLHSRAQHSACNSSRLGALRPSRSAVHHCAPAAGAQSCSWSTGVCRCVRSHRGARSSIAECARRARAPNNTQPQRTCEQQQGLAQWDAAGGGGGAAAACGRGHGGGWCAAGVFERGVCHLAYQRGGSFDKPSRHWNAHPTLHTPPPPPPPPPPAAHRAGSSSARAAGSAFTAEAAAPQQALQNSFDAKTDKGSADLYFHYYGLLMHQQNMLQVCVGVRVCRRRSVCVCACCTRTALAGARSRATCCWRRATCCWRPRGKLPRAVRPLAACAGRHAHGHVPRGHLREPARL